MPLLLGPCDGGSSSSSLSTGSVGGRARGRSRTAGPAPTPEGRGPGREGAPESPRKANGAALCWAVCTGRGGWVQVGVLLVWWGCVKTTSTRDNGAERGHPAPVCRDGADSHKKLTTWWQLALIFRGPETSVLCEKVPEAHCHGLVSGEPA